MILRALRYLARPVGKSLREGWLSPPRRNPHAVALGKLSAEALKEKRRQVHRQLAAAVGKDWAW
jgi:hypothetical protein